MHPVQWFAIAMIGATTAAWSLRTLLRLRAWRGLRRAAGARSAEVLIWSVPASRRGADAYGIVCVDERPRLLQTPTAFGALLIRWGVDEIPLRPDVLTLGSFAHARDHWGVQVQRGEQRWIVAPRARTRAAALALRDELAGPLGAERPRLAIGELPRFTPLPAKRTLEVAASVGVLFALCQWPFFLNFVIGRTDLVATAVLTLVLVFIGGSIASWRRRRRTGRAEFFERGVQVTRTHGTWVAWSDVRGYDDGASDVIWLRGKSWGVVGEAIPTPTERDRTAVLELLDRRGLRRVEG